MPSRHSLLDAPRVQLGLHGHAPAIASRADETLAYVWNRCFLGWRKVARWQVALAIEGIAVRLSQLTVAFNDGEDDGVGGGSHVLPEGICGSE